MPRPTLSSALSLVALDTVDSTNEEARRRAQDGAADGTVVWAKAQTSGRGRRGRKWVSEPGNLYCSIIVRPHYPASVAMQLSFVAATAVASGIRRFLPAHCQVTCKWPNDVLVEGRKVAGLLLESAAQGPDSLDWLVVGIGINLEHFPDDAAYPATCLRREGAGPGTTVEDLLVTVCNRFQTGLVMWRNLGFAPVRRDWMRRAHGMGAPIIVRLANSTLEGTFHTLDADGALILRQPDGDRRITAGDVFYAPAAAPA